MWDIMFSLLFDTYRIRLFTNQFPSVILSHPERRKAAGHNNHSIVGANDSDVVKML